MDKIAIAQNYIEQDRPSMVVMLSIISRWTEYHGRNVWMSICSLNKVEQFCLIDCGVGDSAVRTAKQILSVK